MVRDLDLQILDLQILDLQIWTIKKGPRGPFAHRLVVGGRQPPPAVCQGTTRIITFVILLRMDRYRFPKVARRLYGPAAESQVRTDDESLSAPEAFEESESAWESHAPASLGDTQVNSGS